MRKLSLSKNYTNLMMLVAISLCTSCSMFYRKKPISSTFNSIGNHRFEVRYFGFDSIVFKDLEDKNIQEFFQTMAKMRLGRKQLKHLLRTNADIHIEISERTGIMFKDSLYYLVAGLTGVSNLQSNALIPEYYQPILWWKDSNYVFKENSIILFKGFLENPDLNPKYIDSTNAIILEWKTNDFIHSFSMDSITIEPIRYADKLFKNKTELFYFAGIHEIEHLRPENIKQQIKKGDIEKRPVKIEKRAFRRRNHLNKKN